MKTKPAIAAALLAASITFPGYTVETGAPVSPGTSALAGQPPKVHNRAVTVLAEGDRSALRLDERAGDGLAWWPDAAFADGAIEFDVRGRDSFQKSFVGVAFHGLDEETYDAVYFRPFNFRAGETGRRNHAVQYIAQPIYTWQKLRSEQPEKYEKPVAPPPDPNGWFHVRIVVTHPEVKVFVNETAEPCLVVRQLSDRQTGWVGFWVGNGSGGDFANLKITPAPRNARRAE
jgi:hypothetical protein